MNLRRTIQSYDIRLLLSGPGNAPPSMRAGGATQDPEGFALSLRRRPRRPGTEHICAAGVLLCVFVTLLHACQLSTVDWHLRQLHQVCLSPHYTQKPSLQLVEKAPKPLDSMRLVSYPYTLYLLVPWTMATGPCVATPRRGSRRGHAPRRVRRCPGITRWIGQIAGAGDPSGGYRCHQDIQRPA
jgi:hypothetical protein